MHIDDAKHPEHGEGDEKPAARGKVDYSGAREKTNPEEIKLVRKLDRWIMVNLNQLIPQPNLSKRKADTC